MLIFLPTRFPKRALFRTMFLTGSMLAVAVGKAGITDGDVKLQDHVEYHTFYLMKYNDPISNFIN